MPGGDFSSRLVMRPRSRPTEGETEMLNPHAKLTLARERQNMFLAEAEAARQARQARWRRRSAAAKGTRGVLRDGSKVLIPQGPGPHAPPPVDGVCPGAPQSPRVLGL